MRIGVPVGQFHPGSTADYVVRALRTLGHEAAVVSSPEFAQVVSDPAWDFFLGVDSGVAFDFTPWAGNEDALSHVAFWFIDYRHNKARTSRYPADRENALALLSAGGLVLQAQYEDFFDCRREGMRRCVWLPLGADPDVWRPDDAVTVQFDLGFIGNVWDHARAKVLEALLRSPQIRFLLPRPGSLWMNAGSHALAACKAGFNINSFFDTPWCYDVNMRVFETLSCGRPLITNAVPSLKRVFPKNAPFIRSYSSVYDLLPAVTKALADEEFLASGEKAREFILSEATYVHRVREALLHLIGVPL